MSKRPSRPPTADQLVQEFAAAAIRDYDAKEIHDVEAGRIAIQQKRAAVRALDAIPPAGRTALVPLLDHPDLGVVVSAATYLCQIMPDRVVPILKRIAEMKAAELSELHAWNATMRAWSTLTMYEKGILNLNL